MIPRSVLRYWRNADFRARMLAYGRRYEKSHRAQRTLYKRIYRQHLTPAQKAKQARAYRRWYCRHRAKFKSPEMSAMADKTSHP